jgi:hypothetical protein
MNTNVHTLHLPGRVLAAEDLRRSLNGHRRIVVQPSTVITPLASEQLRSNGVEIAHEDEVAQTAPIRIGVAQDRPYPLVGSALTALARERLPLRELPASGEGLLCQWARQLGECLVGGECQAGVVFSQDPCLVCCVINKLPGLRAAAVTTVEQASRATLTLGANLLAVEMPGRTFYEVRQIIRGLCQTGQQYCPPGVACTLQELDGHAHR